MFETKNPFYIQGYSSPSTFCDRKEETAAMISALQNGRNVTLFSLRRMGKTGLIFHVGSLIAQKKNVKFLYTDIFNTNSTEQLAAKLGDVLLKELAPKRSLLKWVSAVFKAIVPKIAFDPLSGAPGIEFDFRHRDEAIKTLENIFAYLRSLKVQIVWGLDEFQQVTAYEDKGTEALLRGLIQQTPNVNFIFSGSHKTMLMNMFTHSKRPFYQSTQWIELKEIDEKAYTTFILKHFNKTATRVNRQDVKLILDYTMRHTWYTQYLCNHLYAGGRQVNAQKIRWMMTEILKEKENYYLNYRSMLSLLQWQLTRAIALEEKVYEPTAQSFISKYQLSGPSAVSRALESLLSQDMLAEIQEDGRRYYRLNDVFLIRWFQWVY